MVKSKKCPVCGARIKIENLERHLKKVHPKEKVDLKLTKKEKDEVERVKEREKKLTRTSHKAVYAVAAIIMVIIVIAAVLFINAPSGEESNGSPQVEVSSNSYDFGNVSDPDTLTYDFTIGNIGTGVLRITKMETSCICTSASLKVDTQTSGPFTKSPSDWEAQLNPGETAILTIDWNTLYSGTPQSGLHTRQANIYTNDPSYSIITFEIKANILR